MNRGGAGLRFANSKKTPMECRNGREGEMDAGGRWGRIIGSMMDGTAGGTVGEYDDNK